MIHCRLAAEKAKVEDHCQRRPCLDATLVQTLAGLQNLMGDFIQTNIVDKILGLNENHHTPRSY